MAANTDPIYSKSGDIQSTVQLAISANTAGDGSGTLIPVYQADTTNGGYVQKIIAVPVATAAAVATTVLRVFVSTITGSWTGNSSSNTYLVGEITLTGVTTSNTAASPRYEMPLNFALPAGYRIVVGFPTATAASAGYSVTVIGGKY